MLTVPKTPERPDSQEAFMEDLMGTRELVSGGTGPTFLGGIVQFYRPVGPGLLDMLLGTVATRGDKQHLEILFMPLI